MLFIESHRVRSVCRLTTLLETKKKKKQIVDGDAAIRGSGECPIIEVGAWSTLCVQTEKVQKIIDVDAAIAHSAALPIIYIGNAEAASNRGNPGFRSSVVFTESRDHPTVIAHACRILKRPACQVHSPVREVSVQIDHAGHGCPQERIAHERLRAALADNDISTNVHAKGSCKPSWR